jgi:hypothetical protein
MFSYCFPYKQQELPIAVIHEWSWVDRPYVKCLGYDRLGKCGEGWGDRTPNTSHYEMLSLKSLLSKDFKIQDFA